MTEKTDLKTNYKVMNIRRLKRFFVMPRKKEAVIYSAVRNLA